MDIELVKTYRLLQEAKQTEEVIQIRKQIRESLQHQLKTHFNEMFAIGQVIGYDAVKDEFSKALEVLEQKKQMA